MAAGGARATIIPHDMLLQRMVENYKQLLEQIKSVNPNKICQDLHTPISDGEEEQSILGFVEEELPYCDVSRESMVHMQKQQADWLKASKGILERHRLQPRVAKTIGCVDKQHQQFRRLLQKDALANTRLNDLQKRRSEMVAVKGKLRDVRHTQVRARRYFRDYEQGLKQKMQHLDTAEEQAFRQGFGQVVHMSKDDMRDLEGHIRCKEEQRMRRLQEGAEQLRQLYQETLTSPQTGGSSSKGLHCKRNGSSTPVMSEDHRALVKEVRKGVGWLECKLASAEDRAHHRHLHVGLMAEKVPRPILKTRIR